MWQAVVIWQSYVFCKIHCEEQVAVTYIGLNCSKSCSDRLPWYRSQFSRAVGRATFPNVARLCAIYRAITWEHSYAPLCDLMRTLVPPMYIVARLVEIYLNQSCNSVRWSYIPPCDHPLWTSRLWILNMLKNQTRPVCEWLSLASVLQHLRSSWNHLRTRHNFCRSLSPAGRNAYVTDSKPEKSFYLRLQNVPM